MENLIEFISVTASSINMFQTMRLSYTWKFDDMPDFPETTVVWELEQFDPSKDKIGDNLLRLHR